MKVSAGSTPYQIIYCGGDCYRSLGWIDTFALPAKGRNDAAAYAWINFNMRPEIAAKVAASAGNFTASKGADQLMDAKLKAQCEKPAKSA